MATSSKPGTHGPTARCHPYPWHSAALVVALAVAQTAWLAHAVDLEHRAEHAACELCLAALGQASPLPAVIAPQRPTTWVEKVQKPRPEGDNQPFPGRPRARSPPATGCAC
jgi:hypothetical protein